MAKVISSDLGRNPKGTIDRETLGDVREKCIVKGPVKGAATGSW